MPVQIHDISHTFGERLILDHISLTVHAGERVGIVGNNGAGKSTLLQIIAGGRASDYGHVSYDPATEIGYLPQTVAALPGQSIADLLSQARQRIIALEQQLQHLASQLTTATGAEQTALLHTYGEVAARFELAGGYELDYRIAMVLYGLGLGHLAPGRLLETLSGGEKTRVALAALLLGVPDLLLLDEPTNHLDAAAADWLERYLIEQPGAVLVVSHDRRLLDRVATRIIELDEHSHQISSYGGNYSAYRQHKERERQAWVERYAREQAEIADLRQQLATRPQRTGALRTPRRDHDKLSYHFKGQRLQQTVAREVRNVEQRLQRMLADAVPQPPVPLRFCATFEPSTLVQGTLLRVEQLSKAFTADRPLFQAMSFELAPHDRLLISGANGAGKSTLLRILAGAVPPDTGTFCWHPHAIVGYLAQEDQCPNDDRTVLQHYRTGRIGYPQDHERELLTYGLVAPEDLHRPVRLLSVGQRRKLALACLLAQQANVLLLDEPTNQLSLELAEQLEQALDVFTGAIILVTHERWLIEHFCAMHCQIAHGQLQRTMI